MAEHVQHTEIPMATDLPEKHCREKLNVISLTLGAVIKKVFSSHVAL